MAISQLRNLASMANSNDGTRTLTASLLVPELREALEAWKTSSAVQPLVIGGVAYSYYCRPRTTSDIDVLMMSDTDIPDAVLGFKKVTPHVFRHLVTHVDIEIVTPSFVGVSLSLFQQVSRTAIQVEGVRIPSIDGLIALKVCRFNRQDKADVEKLLDLAPLFALADWPGIREEKRQAFRREFPNQG